MIIKKYRWSRDYESAEEELLKLLANKKIQAIRVELPEFEDLTIIKYDIDKQIWCVEGSIVFSVNGKDITLQAGDTIDLPANTLHAAKAGFSGVVYYESPDDSL